MARYIRKYGRIGFSLGPSEERGFAMWVGYDIAGEEGDLSYAGLINVDGWSDGELAPYGVTTFIPVAPEDVETYRKLGIRRK